MYLALEDSWDKDLWVPTVRFRVSTENRGTSSVLMLGRKTSEYIKRTNGKQWA